MPNFVVGIDLAQHVDHAAMCIVERLVHVTELAFPTREEREDFYRIVYLREWPLGAAPQVVVADLAEVIFLSRGNLEDAYIVYDATGIGASWSDLFRRRHMAGDLTRKWPRGFTITGEQTPSHGSSVRKIDLMSKLQFTAGDDRLEMDPDHHLAGQFAAQLNAITAKPTTSGRLSFGAPQSVHDDLVAAVSLALHFRSPVEPRMYGTVPAPPLDPLAVTPG